MLFTILQSGLDGFTNPDSINLVWAFVAMSLLGMVAYFAIRLRSVITTVTWTFAVLVLVLAMLVQEVPIDIFWAILAMGGIMAMVSMIIKVEYGGTI